MNNKIRAGLAVGILFGIYAFLLGLAAAWLDWGTRLVDVMGSLYVGFDATFVGSVIGFGWAFADGFIAGFVVLWLYERFGREE